MYKYLEKANKIETLQTLPTLQFYLLIKKSRILANSKLKTYYKESFKQHKF